MPGQKCKACGGPSEWEPDIAATVCTRCGTLEDPDQIVLAADLEPHERGQGGGRERVLPGMPFALKSTRTAGWSLPGQGKEGRDARNKVQYTFPSLLTSTAYPPCQSLRPQRG
jgi:transcription factor IIIB subunit 2